MPYSVRKWDESCLFCLVSYAFYLSFFRTLASSGKELRDPFLKALAVREEANRSGKMTVSIIKVNLQLTGEFFIVPDQNFLTH